MTRVATVLFIVVFGADCDTDFAKGFGDLFSIRDGVVEIVDAKNVKVNLQNGSALTIYIINSSLNLQSAQSRNVVADKISRMAYERFTNRQKLEVVYVVFSAHEKKFAVVNITSTVQTFQYTLKDIKGLMDDDDTATPRRPKQGAAADGQPATLATRSRLYELFPPGWEGNHLFRQVNLPV